MKRMWINQPSTNQPLHKLHGTNVLVKSYVFEDWGDSITVWFTSGEVISQLVPKNCLSSGWKC